MPLSVITGPTAGIGRVFAGRLAQRGHALLLIARDTARLDALAAELTREHGVVVRTLGADLSREDEIERVARELEREPAVDVLVNNAGFGTKGMIRDTDLAAQMCMLRLHMLAPMRLTRAVLPGMAARRSGAVINVSSVASYLASAGNANYNASKAYLRFFSEALAAEMHGTGVHIQALCPGYTHTEFHARAGMRKADRPSWLWLDAERVVDESLAHAARNGPPVCIPGKRYKAIAFVLKHAPDWMMRAALTRRTKKTREQQKAEEKLKA